MTRPTYTPIGRSTRADGEPITAEMIRAALAAMKGQTDGN